MQVVTTEVPRGSYSVGEVAKALGLGYAKTWGLVTAGKIRSYQIGRRRLVPASELVDFPARMLAEQSVELTAAE